MTMFNSIHPITIDRDTFEANGRYFTLSTVCLGRAYGGKFETMLFSSPRADDLGDEVECLHTSDRKEAQQNHTRVLKKWTEALGVLKVNNWMDEFNQWFYEYLNAQ